MRERPRIADAVGRSAAVDAARGLVIVGVVFNHVVLGLTAASMLDPSSHLARFNAALYLFRMAALAVVLGLFIPRGVQRRGTRGYLLHRLPVLVYLYTLWSLLQGALSAMASGEKNYPTSWSSVFYLWYPDGQLWFLPFLVSGTVLLVVLQPWQRTPMARAGAVVLVAVSIAMCGSATHVAGLRGLALVGFAMVGALIGLERMVRWLRGGLGWWVLALALGLGLFLICWSAGPYPPTEPAPSGALGGRLISLIAAACGVLMILALTAAMRRVRLLERLFAMLGRRSLEIFLAHLSFAFATRYGLNQLGVHAVGVHVALGVVVGVGAPLALAVLTSRLGTPWLFQLPVGLQQRLDRPQPDESWQFDQRGCARSRHLVGTTSDPAN